MLRTIFAIAMSLAWVAATASAAAGPGAAAGLPPAVSVTAVVQAQQSGAQNNRRVLGPLSQSNTRILGPSSQQAVTPSIAAKLAQRCTGGQVLKVDASGSGYNVRVLVGNQAVVVRVDQGGNCR